MGGSGVCNVTEEECRNHQSVLAINARHTSNTFRYRKVKRHEVLTALKEIKPNKATGYDMLPPRVLKMAAGTTGNTHYFQSSYSGKSLA